MAKIKKGDIVKVLIGGSAGQSGKVLNVLKDGRLIVDGVNLVKKHVKANPNIDEKGGVKEKEAPIARSNVALAVISGKIDNKGRDYSKVGYKFLEDGKKVRYCKQNGEIVE